MIWTAFILIALFGLSLKKPVWGFGLIVAFLPVYLFRFDILGIPTTLLELMVGIFLLSVLINKYDALWAKIAGLKRFNLLVGSFLLAGVISALISPEPLRALGQLKAFFIEPILLFYAALVVLKNKEDAQTVLKFLFWSALAISLFGLVQYWTNFFLPIRFWGYGAEMKRITSVFEYPNALALYLAPVFVLFLTLWSKGEYVTKKYWMYLGLVVMFAALVLTFSRGAWLGALGALILLGIQQSRLSLQKWILYPVIILLLLSPLIYSRFKNTFHDGASSERIELFKAGTKKILSDPILGNGLYGFRTTLEQSNYAGEILNYPHNLILNFWLETGLLGVVSLVLLVFFSLRAYAKKPTPLKLAAALFMATVFIHGMVDAPYFKNDLSILFWLGLALFYVEE